MKFSIKKNYEFSNKSRSSWSNSKSNLIIEREKKGIREVKNIINLSKYFLPESNISKIEKYLSKRNLSLLDIGCGDKYISFGCKYFGLKYEGIDYSDCDIEKDKIERNSNSYDVITCMALLEHLRDPSNLFYESYRLLKKNGILILSTPNWHYCMKSFYDDPTHVHPYTPKSLRSLLCLSDFKKIKVIPNLRLKSKLSYIGFAPFLRASKLIPFTNDPKYKLFPSFLKGKSNGLFGIAIKN